MDDPRSLSSEELLARLDRFVEEERERLHSFLSWLGEADRRKLPEEWGYSSTFDFCIRRLKLSEDESYRRIHAARATVSRPELLSALADGQLSLSAVSKIAPFVHRPDAPEIISRAEGKSARQIDEMLAPLRPEPERRSSVRVVAVASGSGTDGAPVLRVDFSFRGPLALREAIDRARQLLGHKCPSGAIDEILLEIARDYLARHDPEKGLPGRLSPVKGGSSLPARVRRSVWARDGARCAYIGTTGVRCLARRSLEVDHVKPRALGGTDEIGNLRLLCRAHNDSERRRILGEGTAIS
ncbi:MAG: HNH endonuclease [Elusimicrobia bacterium]|nr:HNH endonuclease [Elusimicrobiota bacterium]